MPFFVECNILVAFLGQWWYVDWVRVAGCSRMLASDYSGTSIEERETAAKGIGGSSPLRCDLSVLQCASVVVLV